MILQIYIEPNPNQLSQHCRICSFRTMKKAELVFLPVPGTGHLVSFVQLAKLLVDLNSNLSVTFLILYPHRDPKVTAYVDSLPAEINTAGIKFVNITRSDPNVGFSTFLFNVVQTHGPLVKQVVSNIVKLSNSVPDSPRLAGFVLDMLFTCFTDLADEFGVPSYGFYTTGAAFLGFQLCTQALHDDENVEFIELKDSDTEFAISSFVNPVPVKFFPARMFNPETSSFVLDMTRGIRKTKGILVNTFSELESHAVNSLSDDGKLHIPRVYPVGPILDLKNSAGANHNHDTIMRWLDDQPRSSVVFLCFGSMGSFGANQVKEIAYALERSGHRFLWSLRRPGEQVNGKSGSPTDYENVTEVLPGEFLDRTAGIGKVVGWVAQTAILSHPAIGGFVSHCGWNSTLESMWFGVPMATWPLYAEQKLNALLLVKELRLAVEIKADYKNDGDEVEIVKAEKIENGIRSLMERDSDVRKRAKEMSDSSMKALMDGGSSRSALNRFIDDVLDNMPKD